MFAVIRTGGKQYVVSKDSTIRVEKLEGNVGDVIEISDVVMLGGDKPSTDAKALEKAVVRAEIVRQFRDKKIIIFKKKRRQNYRRKNGHRQSVSEIKITEISA